MERKNRIFFPKQTMYTSVWEILHLFSPKASWRVHSDLIYQHYHHVEPCWVNIQLAGVNFYCILYFRTQSPLEGSVCCANTECWLHVCVCVENPSTFNKFLKGLITIRKRQKLWTKHLRTDAFFEILIPIFAIQIWNWYIKHVLNVNLTISNI